MSRMFLKQIKYCTVKEEYEFELDEAFIAKIQSICDEMLHSTSYRPIITKEMLADIWDDEGDYREYEDISLILKKYDYNTKSYIDEVSGTQSLVDFINDILYDEISEKDHDIVDRQIEDISHHMILR